jgi:hypothetical protein
LVMTSPRPGWPAYPGSIAVVGGSHRRPMRRIGAELDHLVLRKRLCREKVSAFEGWDNSNSYRKVITQGLPEAVESPQPHSFLVDRLTPGPGGVGTLDLPSRAS